MRKPKVMRPPEPTATRTVSFPKKGRPGPRPIDSDANRRIPRVARLLALAHKIDGMIRASEIKDWAEAARLVGVTRGRMTQIANLLLLAPNVQEMIMELPQALKGLDPITEHALRPFVALTDWDQQQQLLAESFAQTVFHRANVVERFKLSSYAAITTEADSAQRSPLFSSSTVNRLPEIAASPCARRKVD